MDKHIIVHADQRRYESSIKYIENSDLSDVNKKLLLSFKDCLRRDGIGFKRIAKYLYHFGLIAKWIDKDLDKITKDDINRVIDHIDGNGYTYNTQYDFKVCLKKFYKWLYKVDKDPFSIKTPSKKKRTKLPTTDELFTLEEIKRMTETAGSIRNSAMVITLYESGSRASEFLTLQIKDLEFDEFGAKVRLVGKTGERFVRLVMAVPYLLNWISNHPTKHDKNSWLWVNENRGFMNRNFDKPIGYTPLREIIRNILQKTGVSRRGNLHSFRKSRACYMANFLTESQLCNFFGWSIGSEEVATYVKSSMRQTEEAVLKMHGLHNANRDQHDRILQPIKCDICMYFNDSKGKFCGRCGKPLGIAIAIEAEQRKKDAEGVLDWMAKEPEFQEVVERLMKKHNAINI